ncbi:hypothetical protein QYE76_018558 [Lolium multiflorum]|uniref:Retrotransposon gag domain-containing protein n=1 Tax=Lolium multiflorum TaxID=4521 RepID=A0AAD8Q7X2_LOLMU|nr:hypothetical protein QYE76_018558 [Lolium multiflorum]
MEIIIALVDRTLVMMILAPTQGAESSIAMLVLMSVLNKTKLFTKIVIKRLAMPTMGMTTNPKTTSSTTWTRHLIVKPMWMLKTKVIKIHQGVTSGTILAMTKGAEDNLNMIKMRGPTLDNVNNLDKIRNNFINVSQVKLVFTSTANPMLWNMEDEENMYGKLKFNMPKFKGEDDAEAYLSWALKVDKIFRIHNYSGAKKVAMASLEFEDYANTWWEQVVTLREEKGDPPIDTWEDMKEEMQARFVPKHYKTDLFNKLQKLKQGTKTVEEFFKEMELTMMRANIQESENQTIARFFNGLNYPIKRIVEFQQYSNMVELVHQASKAERQVNEDIKYDVAPLTNDTTSRPTSPPSGPMTRARVKALHDKVNSLLSTSTFDTPLDGLLLHANTLCSIRYIGQDTSHGVQANGERAGNDEDGAPAHRPELPPSRTGTSGQIPPRCCQDAVQRPEKWNQPELPPPGTGTSAHPELPPKFRPSSESPSKRPWMLLQGNGLISELDRNLAGTSGRAGTSAFQGRNFRP